MKKYIMMSLTLIATLMVTSCKSSSEAEFRKQYDKARSQELYAQDDSDPVEVSNVTPVEETKSYTSIRQRKSSSTTTTTTKQANNNTNFRSERLTVVSGGTLKVYNVVAGSFKSQENANKRCNELKDKGYSSKVAQNPDTGMYRVIASSHDTKDAAISSRDKLRNSYPDAWLLYKKD